MKTETVTAIYDRRRQSPASGTLHQDRQIAATERAVELLRKGDMVALPTETVYGLAADALSPIAVARIFEAKERPRFDPLIVHLPDEQWLERVAIVDNRSQAQIKELIAQFWPGPLTLVLPRQPIVPEIVTAGLDTIAVRMSSHPVFAEIISAFGKPVAAPSANRFGRISPTAAQHVFNELSGRIPLIIDAGPTMYGIESTIVAVHEDKINIMRRGGSNEYQSAECRCHDHACTWPVAIALRAENSASLDRQRQNIHAKRKAACRVARLECVHSRKVRSRSNSK